MTTDISDLPPVSYTRSVRARNLRITINHDKTIKVTVPKQTTRQHAEQFLQSKISWIKKHLHKIEQQEKLQAGVDLSDEELIKAQEELFCRLDYFSDKYNLPYNRVVFRCQKTKWGSCSDKKNINLNINIAYLPKELQDYVLLHELCHIKHKNHSKQFWASLDGFLGGRAKDRSKELRKWRMRIERIE